MKVVSDAYKESMKGMLRNRSYVRVTFGNVDPTAADDGAWVSNGELAFSEVATLDYPFDYQASYAALELNLWVLDGNTQVAPVSDFEDGFISNKVSDENGEFTSPAVLVREFSEPHTFPGLSLTFDTRHKDYPLSVTVDFYLNGSVVESKTVAVQGTSVVVDTTAEEVDKLTVTFGDGLPYRRPRLERTVYGVEKIFENDDIVSTRQSHDVDPLSRRLPLETMQFVVLDYEHNYDPDNPSGVYAFIEQNSPVTIQYGYELPNGKVEWLKADSYLLDGKPSVKNNQATFNATGLIGSLNNTFYKSKVGTKSFYDMAEEVLQDAGLTPTASGDDPWEIDEALQDMYTTAVLPIDTHMNCLQRIAHACRCRLYTDDDNIIHLKPFGVTIRGIYRGEWEDNGHEWYSEYETLDGGNPIDNTYITLELNRWVLSGENQVVIPTDTPSGRGFVSSLKMDADGTCTTPPTLVKTFEVAHDLPVLALRFDGDYPTAVQAKFYNENTLLDTQTVTDISSPELFIYTNDVTDCTKFEVSMLSGLPYYRFRVGKIFYRETDFTLDFTTIAENSQSISKIDQLKAVTVAKYSYSAESEAQTLFEGMTTEDQLHVEFSGLAENVEITITDGTLLTSEVYGRAADLVLSSGTKSVLITGQTLSENSVVISYPVATDGEIDKEENSLITNDEMCAALADHVIKYLQMRNTYDADYRGNPEIEVGDIIGLQTLYTNEMDALVLVDEISFNGALSGKMKVKGLI